MSKGLNIVQRSTLLSVARQAIEDYVRNGELTLNPVDDPVLNENRGCFVTIRKMGDLRGCIGSLEPSRPLAQDVAHNAFQAAFRDPRFDPLREHEFETLRVELSVLSPMEPIDVANEADLLGRLTPHVDGLVIIEGARRATFLPKVWESLPDPEQFLGHLRLKCGLPKDYWSEHLEFHRYGTTTYAESD